MNKKVMEVEWKERRWKQLRPDNGEGFGSYHIWERCCGILNCNFVTMQENYLVQEYDGVSLILYAITPTINIPSNPVIRTFHVALRT